MDNLLIQVIGRKRVVLYSPREATNLYLNGDKSEVLDIDNPDLSRFPKFTEVIPYECLMEPGDVLFIPAMWFHNVISLEVSDSCNISNMRCSVSSPDETLRRELKIRHIAEYFLTNLEVFHLVMKHCVELLILLLKQNYFRRGNYGCKNEQFFKDSFKINFLCTFFMNY